MVQIIQANPKKDFMAGLLGGFANTLPHVMDKFYDRNKEERQHEHQKELLSQKNAQSQEQKAKERLLEDEGYKTIETTFGPNTASVWKAATVQGKSELLKAALDSKLRGHDVEATLAPYAEQAAKREEQAKNNPVSETQPQKQKVSSDYEFPVLDSPQGYTPKEMVSHKKELRNQNSPIFQEVRKKSAATKREGDLTKVLVNLNEGGNLPEGLGKLVLNPETGEPYALAQMAGAVHPDVQKWVKTINEFTTKAKDSYGSRVTNFDLIQFLKRYPSLLNTKEGRGIVLEQMQDFNEIDALYQHALKETYQHYGLDGITEEKADEVAENVIEDRVEALREKITENTERVESMFPGRKEEEKSSSSKGKQRRSLDEIIPFGG